MKLACGAAASGRWGEAPSERIFFMKTTKTAGSELRQMFERFAISAHMGRLSSSRPGGVLFSDVSTLLGPTWLSSKHLRQPNHHLSGGDIRPRASPGNSPFDIADDHSSWVPRIIDQRLPGARLLTISRDPLARATGLNRCLCN